MEDGWGAEEENREVAKSLSAGCARNPNEANPGLGSVTADWPDGHGFWEASLRRPKALAGSSSVDMLREVLTPLSDAGADA